jgi:transcriptional repressor NrdR
VTNSRSTKGNSQIWRRRKCLSCSSLFTTHEIIDLSHLFVIKKSGNVERYNRIKLYSGIYGATVGSKVANREFLVDKITRETEKDLLGLKKKVIKSTEIADIVLNILRKFHTATFLRFLARNKNIETEAQMKREFSKYTKN